MSSRVFLQNFWMKRLWGSILLVPLTFFEALRSGGHLRLLTSAEKKYQTCCQKENKSLESLGFQPAVCRVFENFPRQSSFKFISIHFFEVIFFCFLDWTLLLLYHFEAFLNINQHFSHLNWCPSFLAYSRFVEIDYK